MQNIAIYALDPDLPDGNNEILFAVAQAKNPPDEIPAEGFAVLSYEASFQLNVGQFTGDVEMYINLAGLATVGMIQDLDQKLEEKLDATVLTSTGIITEDSTLKLQTSALNLKTGATSSQKNSIPIATTTTDGIAHASDIAAISSNTTRISALESGSALMRRPFRSGSAVVITDQAVLTAAWVTAGGSEPVPDGATLIDLDNNFYAYTYFVAETSWQNRGVDSVMLATNSAPGIVLGSTRDGDSYANSDGTLSVNGWDDLLDDVADKVDKVTGKGLSANDYTDDEKTKLAGIAANANNYTLPTATNTVLGGVKVTPGNGLVNSSGDISMNLATITTPGAMSAEDKVKVDNFSGGGGYQVFTANGTFDFKANVVYRLIVVGGGGGGGGGRYNEAPGYRHGGGGGGGGGRYNEAPGYRHGGGGGGAAGQILDVIYTPATTQTLNITVGTGGAGGALVNASTGNSGQNGNPSSVGTIFRACGGGAGTGASYGSSRGGSGGSTRYYRSPTTTIVSLNTGGAYADSSTKATSGANGSSGAGGGGGYYAATNPAGGGGFSNYGGCPSTAHNQGAKGYGAGGRGSGFSWDNAGGGGGGGYVDGTDITAGDSTTTSNGTGGDGAPGVVIITWN